MSVSVSRREDVLLHRVDVGLDEIGDVEVGVHHVVGDRVHHRIRTELAIRGSAVHLPAHACQPTVVAVAHGDHEVASDEDHDLAGLDDLAGHGHRLVLDVVHGLEHQEQRVVVALEFGALVGVHGVFDREFVQPEDDGDGLHLVFVGFVKTYPHEGGDAVLLEFLHLGQGGGVGVLAGQPAAVGIDATVDHRPRDGHVNRVRVEVASRRLAGLNIDGCRARNDGMRDLPSGGRSSPVGGLETTVEMVRPEPGRTRSRFSSRVANPAG